MSNVCTIGIDTIINRGLDSAPTSSGTKPITWTRQMKRTERQQLTTHQEEHSNEWSPPVRQAHHFGPRRWEPFTVKRANDRSQQTRAIQHAIKRGIEHSRVESTAKAAPGDAHSESNREQHTRLRTVTQAPVCPRRVPLGGLRVEGQPEGQREGRWQSVWE